MKQTVEELAGRYRDNLFAAAFNICKMQQMQTILYKKRSCSIM